MEAYSSADEGVRIVGIIGILVGVSTIALLVPLLYIAAEGSRPTPEQTLSAFNANQSAYGLYAAGVTLFATFVIALAGGFSVIVRKRSSSVSFAAALLVAAGVLTVALGDDLFIGSLFAISQAPSTAAYATDGTYFAAVASNFTNILTKLGLSLIGIGLLLFAWMTWKYRIFPKWLSYVLLIGGVFGVLAALPVLQFPDIASAILIGVWGFGSAGVLLRTKSAPVEPAK